MNKITLYFGIFYAMFSRTWCECYLTICDVDGTNVEPVKNTVCVSENLLGYLPVNYLIKGVYNGQ